MPLIFLPLRGSVKISAAHRQCGSEWRCGSNIRYSTTTDVLIPWEGIVEIQNRRRDLDRSKTVQVVQTESGAVMSIGVLKQTNVEIVLSEPRSVTLPKGPSEPVTAIRFYADDPLALIRKARELQAS